MDTRKRSDSVVIRPAVVSDASAIFHLVNTAYAVETGSEGIAFKCSNRLSSLSELDAVIAEHRCIAAFNTTGTLLGCIVYDIKKEQSECHFGPFAVDPSVQGSGVGSSLMRSIDDVALAHDVKWISISVVNHRTDILPMYSALGFVEYGTEPFPVDCIAELTRPVTMILMRRRVRNSQSVPDLPLESQLT